MKGERIVYGLHNETIDYHMCSEEDAIPANSDDSSSIQKKPPIPLIEIAKFYQNILVIQQKEDGLYRLLLLQDAFNKHLAQKDKLESTRNQLDLKLKSVQQSYRAATELLKPKVVEEMPVKSKTTGG